MSQSWASLPEPPDGLGGGCPCPSDLLRVTPQRSGSPPSRLPLSLLGDAASRSPWLLCLALRGSVSGRGAALLSTAPRGALPPAAPLPTSGSSCSCSTRAPCCSDVGGSPRRRLVGLLVGLRLSAEHPVLSCVAWSVPCLTSAALEGMGPATRGLLRSGWRAGVLPWSCCQSLRGLGALGVWGALVVWA